MHFAAGEQDFEQATIERNRLQAVRALLERQRVADERRRHATTRSPSRSTGTEANAQVFQVRDGVLSRPPVASTSTTRPSSDAGERRRGVHAPVLRERAVDPAADRRPGRAGRGLRARGARRDARRAPRRPGRDPRRRARRQAPHPRAGRAQRAARARPGEAARSERRRQQRVEALDGAAGARSGSTRCRCGSSASTSRNLGGTHTVASMVVFEGGAPKKSDYRRFTIRDGRGRRRLRRDGGGARRAASRSGRSRPSARPYDAERDATFAALPNLDRDRRRQGPARRPGLRAAAGLPRPRRGGRLAGQADRGGLPARAAPTPLVLAARHARAAAAPARARRGAPLRDHPPPRSAATRR